MCRDTWKTRGLNQKLADLDQSQVHVALKAHANTISKEPWLQSLVFLTASAIIALCLSANLLHQILSAAVVLILTFTFSQNSLKVFIVNFFIIIYQKRFRIFKDVKLNFKQLVYHEALYHVV